MIRDTTYSVFGSWGARSETPDLLSRRTLGTMQQLSQIADIAPLWFLVDKDASIKKFRIQQTSIAIAIANGVTKSRDGKQQQPYYGYRFGIFSSPDIRWSARRFRFGLHAGSDDNYIRNVVNFCTFSDHAQSRNLQLDFFKEVLLALAEPFAASFAIAYPDGLNRHWVRGREAPTMQLAWISYVSPRFTHLVMPPPSAIVEHRPDGGLLNAATHEPFDIDNPRHMAVAREIEAAVAPFNALPWPPEDHVD